MDTRTLAAKTLAQVLKQQLSLSGLLPAALEKVAARERGLLQELCYGTLRWYPQLNSYLKCLLHTPLKPKDSDIQALLLIGLYQLLYTRIPDHAAIGATVECAKHLKKHWASKLINATLRSFQRQKTELDEQLAQDPVFLSAHPKWLIKAIESAWPNQASEILAANNLHPPFTLRLNPVFSSREKLLEALEQQSQKASPCEFSSVGVTLDKAADVETLPLFKDGGLSVQDEAAQLAATLLNLAPGQRVLDACCAPGGKTGHILEAEPELAEVVALDSDSNRLKRVEENLTRLKRQAQLLCGDASDPSGWWDGKPFDRILIDAPCSGTGVIRRHPDIKLLRKPADIDKLAQLQLSIVKALWQLLKPGGTMVYATCSVMPKENTQVMEQFIASHPDACIEAIDAAWGIEQPCGRQLFPQADGHDGFYYARLHKQIA